MKLLNWIKKTFASKKYQPIFDCNGKQLKIGQVCKMKFPLRSESKTGYYVGVRAIDNSVYGCKTGLETYIPQKHSAALHDYWSKSLEIVGDKKSHGHLLLNQEI